VSLIESLLIVIVWQTRTQKSITTFLERKKKGNRNKTQTNKKNHKNKKNPWAFGQKLLLAFINVFSFNLCLCKQITKNNILRRRHICSRALQIVLSESESVSLIEKGSTIPITTAQIF
jgi:hypothetical protein